MLLLKPQLLAKARAAASPTDVTELLDGAVELELSTLPPYLTGVFSLAAGNDELRALISSVILEEMLHMALAANTAIAIGGAPPIFARGRALRYPGPLPMCVDETLTVSLGAMTLDQVRDVFMAIERPDTTATLPGEPPAIAQRVLAHKSQGYGSIGEFYAAIIDALDRLVASGQDPFAEPRLDRQLDLARWFPRAVPGYPTGKVHDLASARAALMTIVRQGEGAQIGADPIDPYGGGEAFAHYFKFGEIAHQHRLIRDAAAPSGWSYTGAPVPYDARKIYAFPPNASVRGYAEGTAARVTATAFYDAYERLLRTLDRTFNGAPAAFDAALGIMFEMKLVAQQVVQQPAGDGLVAAPPFQPDLA